MTFRPSVSLLHGWVRGLGNLTLGSVPMPAHAEIEILAGGAPRGNGCAVRDQSSVPDRLDVP